MWVSVVAICEIKRVKILKRDSIRTNESNLDFSCTYLQNDEKIQVNDQTTKKYLCVYIPDS